MHVNREICRVTYIKKKATERLENISMEKDTINITKKKIGLAVLTSDKKL